MAKNYNRLKAQYRRQYVFTRTKAVVGFILSCVFSILINAYLDRYGMVIYEQTKRSFEDSVVQSDADQTQPTRSAQSSQDLREQLSALDGERRAPH